MSAGRLALAALTLALGLVALVPRPALACSGPLVPFDPVVVHPGPTALVTVLAVEGDREAPVSYTFAVDELWRGSWPSVVALPAPVVHGCGDVLVARVGERLVVALDVRAFDAGEPVTAYWSVRGDGQLEDRSVEPQAGLATVDQLRSVIGPVAGPHPNGAGDAGGPGALSIAVGIGIVAIGALVLVAATAAGRRRATH